MIGTIVFVSALRTRLRRPSLATTWTAVAPEAVVTFLRNGAITRSYPPD